MVKAAWNVLRKIALLPFLNVDYGNAAQFSIVSLLSRCRRFAVWEVDRDEEFAPLKNADAPNAGDCPTTCRRALYAQHLRWLLQSGAQVELSADAFKNLDNHSINGLLVLMLSLHWPTFKV